MAVGKQRLDLAGVNAGIARYDGQGEPRRLLPNLHDQHDTFRGGLDWVPAQRAYFVGLPFREIIGQTIGGLVGIKMRNQLVVGLVRGSSHSEL